MSAELPENGIECHIIPRKESEGKAISASTVQKAIQENDTELLKKLVPESTFRYFISPDSAEVIEKSQKGRDSVSPIFHSIFNDNAFSG